MDQEDERSQADDKKIYRKIFTIEGGIRHREHGSLKSILKAVDDLFLLYDLMGDIPPLPVIQMISKTLDDYGFYLKLISPKREISSQLVRKMRFSGISDLTVVSSIRQAQKEGIKRENPGGKVKYLDPRFARLS